MCLKFSEAFGLGNTVGVGPSSVSQGLIMTFAFAYMARWISVRGGFPFSRIGDNGLGFWPLLLHGNI